MFPGDKAGIRFCRFATVSGLASRFDLQRYGLSWRRPELDCVHPLDDGSAGVLYRSVEQTAAGWVTTDHGGGSPSATRPPGSTR
ncbi:dehydrogenase domain protein [Mycobacterium kansasii]|uniref:Dehydrogenase domain protein n=1 Tax=Mycobacterium kansasii TaxID=1768 RepID=A0A1V3XXE2_MYCKA|nr:dehydrogenase domain protein [Mycobacterium kansasii]